MWHDMSGGWGMGWICMVLVWESRPRLLRQDFRFYK